MKRTLWILLTPTVIVILIGMIFNRFFAPQILQALQNKVESLSRRNGPIEAKIKILKLQYLPPGLVAEGVTLKPKTALSNYLSDVQVEKIKAELAIFPLLTGKFKISLIDIESPVVQINIQKSHDEDTTNFELPKNINWEPWMRKLQEIPIEQVLVQNLNLKLLEKKDRVSVSFYPTEIQFLQLRELIQIKVSIPNLVTSWDEKERVKTELNLAAVMTPQSIRIQKFEILNQTLDFNMSGEMKSKKNRELDANILWNGSIKLGEVHNALKQIMPEKHFPMLSGELRAQGRWKPLQQEILNAEFNLDTQDVKIADFSVGNATITGNLKGRDISFEKLSIEHPAGKLELNKTRLGLHSVFPISTELHLKVLDLQALFQSLNLKSIPVEALINGRAPCEGQFFELQFRCHFDANLQSLQVRSGYPKNSFEIVSLEGANAKGQVNIDLHEISYDGQIQMGSSKGSSKGRIQYLKGFDIAYSASQLDWKDVKNLARLNFNGISELSGSTRGDSSQAVFNIKAKTKDHELDGFFLGDTQMDLDYLLGTLSIKNIAAKLDQMNYAGELSLDLHNSSLSGELKSQNARLQDIKKLLEKRIPVPIDIEGTGSLTVKASGPLDFWALDTKVTGQFMQPQIMTEIFNRLDVDIESTNGLYKLKRVEAIRNATTVHLDGTISPQQKLNLQGSLKNALLEESDIISKIGWPLSGKLNSQVKLEGTLNNPELFVSGQISDMILDENEVLNSNFKFQIQDHQALAEGAFFGHQIQASLEWPLQEKSNSTTLRLKTQNWDYTPWLSLFNAGAINEETRGALTAEVNLQSELGHWNQLSGSIKIPYFMITRQDLTLQNSTPITISADQGYYSLQNFLLKSPQKGQVHITGERVHPDHLNLQVNATSDLKLAQIFVPFFEELSGPIQLNASIDGPWNRPQLVGQMNIQNGYFKIKNFPHAFEKVKVDTTFSQSRVLFNDIQGILGGGSIKGEGSLQIQGPEDIPVLLRLKARGVSLNVPNQVKTKGDIDLNFSGRWFPYLLGGTYRISSTNVEMNFGGDTLNPQTKQNYYLPQNVKKRISDPLELDLQLIFEKPMQIKNNLMEAQATGPLSIKGSPSHPVLMGQLKSLKGSQLIFKDKPFNIQSATIQFQNPSEINPDLFITAQTRVEEYDISLLVQGTAKDPSIRLSSVPPLSENDLTSLLALGVTSSKLATVESKEQEAQTRNEVFAAAFQSTGLSKKVQSATGFNVQLSNSFDTTRNISVPKFTVSRKLNKNTNASVAFPVTGDQKTPEGRIQYNLNDNISINGSYETKKFDQSATTNETRETPSILGLDLEFKREFK